MQQQTPRDMAPMMDDAVGMSVEVPIPAGLSSNHASTRGRLRRRARTSEPVLWTLVLDKAEGLDRRDMVGKDDPYALVYVDGKKCGRSKTVCNSDSPEWVDLFNLSLPPGSCTIRLEVWDSDIVTSDDFLGYCVIDVPDTSAAQSERRRHSLLRDGAKGAPREAGSIVFCIRRPFGAHIFEIMDEDNSLSLEEVEISQLRNHFMNWAQIGSEVAPTDMQVALTQKLQKKLGELAGKREVQHSEFNEWWDSLTDTLVDETRAYTVAQYVETGYGFEQARKWGSEDHFSSRTAGKRSVAMGHMRALQADLVAEIPFGKFFERVLKAGSRGMAKFWQRLAIEARDFFKSTIGVLIGLVYPPRSSTIYLLWQWLQEPVEPSIDTETDEWVKIFVLQLLTYFFPPLVFCHFVRKKQEHYPKWLLWHEFARRCLWLIFAALMIISYSGQFARNLISSEVWLPLAYYAVDSVIVSHEQASLTMGYGTSKKFTKIFEELSGPKKFSRWLWLTLQRSKDDEDLNLQLKNYDDFRQLKEMMAQPEKLYGATDAAMEHAFISLHELCIEQARFETHCVDEHTHDFQGLLTRSPDFFHEVIVRLNRYAPVIFKSAMKHIRGNHLDVDHFKQQRRWWHSSLIQMRLARVERLRVTGNPIASAKMHAPFLRMQELDKKLQVANEIFCQLVVAQKKSKSAMRRSVMMGLLGVSMVAVSFPWNVIGTERGIHFDREKTLNALGMLLGGIMTLSAMLIAAGSGLRQVFDSLRKLCCQGGFTQLRSKEPAAFDDLNWDSFDQNEMDERALFGMDDIDWPSLQDPSKANLPQCPISVEDATQYIGHGTKKRGVALFRARSHTLMRTGSPHGEKDDKPKTSHFCDVVDQSAEVSAQVTTDPVKRKRVFSLVRHASVDLAREQDVVQWATDSTAHSVVFAWAVYIDKTRHEIDSLFEKTINLLELQESHGDPLQIKQGHSAKHHSVATLPAALFVQAIRILGTAEAERVYRLWILVIRVFALLFYAALPLIYYWSAGCRVQLESAAHIIGNETLLQTWAENVDSLDSSTHYSQMQGLNASALTCHNMYLTPPHLQPVSMLSSAMLAGHAPEFVFKEKWNFQSDTAYAWACAIGAGKHGRPVEDSCWRVTLQYCPLVDGELMGRDAIEFNADVTADAAPCGHPGNCRWRLQHTCIPSPLDMSLHLLSALAGYEVFFSIFQKVVRVQVGFIMRFKFLRLFSETTPWPGADGQKRLKTYGLLPSFDLNSEANVVCWNRVRVFFQTYEKESFQNQQLTIFYVIFVCILELVHKVYVFLTNAQPLDAEDGNVSFADELDVASLKLLCSQLILQLLLFSIFITGVNTTRLCENGMRYALLRKRTQLHSDVTLFPSNTRRIEVIVPRSFEIEDVQTIIREILGVSTKMQVLNVGGERFFTSWSLIGRERKALEKRLAIQKSSFESSKKKLDDRKRKMLDWQSELQRPAADVKCCLGRGHTPISAEDEAHVKDTASRVKCIETQLARLPNRHGHGNDVGIAQFCESRAEGDASDSEEDEELERTQSVSDIGGAGTKLRRSRSRSECFSMDASIEVGRPKKQHRGFVKLELLFRDGMHEINLRVQNLTRDEKRFRPASEEQWTQILYENADRLHAFTKHGSLADAASFGARELNSPKVSLDMRPEAGDLNSSWADSTKLIAMVDALADTIDEERKNPAASLPIMEDTRCTLYIPCVGIYLPLHEKWVYSLLAAITTFFMTSVGSTLSKAI